MLVLRGGYDFIWMKRSLQFCIMLKMSVDGKERPWGPPATPGPVSSDVFIELSPGEIVSTRREFWFRQGKTAQLWFCVNSENFRQAVAAKKAEGSALEVWSGCVTSGSGSLDFEAMKSDK